MTDQRGKSARTNLATADVLVTIEL